MINWLHGTSLAAASCAAPQELPNILWNREVQCCVHKSPLLVSFLSEIDPVHTILSHIRSIWILSTHLCLGLPSGLFPSGFPTKILYAFSPHSCYIPSPSHPLDLIVLIILGEENKLWSSSSCIFVQLPVTSSLFGPNILTTLFSNTLSLCSSLNVRDQVSHPYRTMSKL
jgi:hypothetical protein